MGISQKISQTASEVCVRLGLKRIQIFGEHPPHPNPYGFETTEEGVPIVPKEEVVTGGLLGTKIVFDGHLVVSGAGDNTFIARTDMGGPSLRKGDMFAFQNQNPARPALVFEVVDSGRKKIEIETQDVGFLEGSADGL